MDGHVDERAIDLSRQGSSSRRGHRRYALQKTGAGRSRTGQGCPEIERNSMRIRLPLALGSMILMALPIAAHHGTGASYDLSSPITLKGAVTEFHYTNPHPQLYFDVTDDKGEVAHWTAEFYPNPAQLIQGGWGRKRSEAALMPGTKITITLAPA